MIIQQNLYIKLIKMPIFNLVLFARTQNVECITASPDTTWLLNIQCSSCNQKFPKAVQIHRNNQVQTQKQQSVANFRAKCKNCERKGYITILPTPTYKAPVNQDGLVKEMIVSFECRGVEIVSVELQDQFSVHVKDSTTVFQNADFSDLWAEYDDKISGLALVQQQKLDIVKGK